MSVIRVLLVDPLVLVRQGVACLLRADGGFQIVGEASDSISAEIRAGELRPEIVLMDVAMPGPCSFEAGRRILRSLPNVRVVFLTAYTDEEYLHEAMRVGASGYILKSDAANVVLPALKDIARGGHYLSSRMVSYLVNDLRQGAPPAQPRSAQLTNREREIVKLIAEGNSVKEVAAALNLSAKTVEAHKCNLMRKLDVHNKAQLVQYAFQRKIARLTPEPGVEEYRIPA